MIAEKLQGNGRNQRLQALEYVGQLNHLVGNLGNRIVTLRNKCNDPTLAGLDFLNVGKNLFVHGVVGGDDDYWHIAINKSNRSVLHFSSRIALGMYVRYLLELQGTLQSHGIGVAAT